jgi:predicted permease
VAEVDRRGVARAAHELTDRLDFFFLPEDTMLSELWSDVSHRARALFRRETVERELDDELRFHIERETEKYERLGMRHADAVRQARLAFGGADRTKEESRDARGTALLETLLQDLRYAARGLRAKPTFTLGVVLTLGLGIGGNAAMFGVVDRMFFRPPAYLRDPSSVHRVFQSYSYGRQESVRAIMQFARYRDLVRWSHDFSSFAAFTTQQMAIGDGAAEHDVYVSGVSASYFDFFDVRPLMGRFIVAADDSMLTGAPVAVLSYAYWQSELGGRRDVLGTRIRVDRTLCTVIGVAPQGFTGIGGDHVPAMYIPVTTFAWDRRPIDYSGNYVWHWLSVIGRLKPGVSVEAATGDLTSVMRRSWIAQNAVAAPKDIVPLDVARPRAFVSPVQLERSPIAGAEAKVVAWVTGVSVIVLLIACANVANLLLARALARRREIALRVALGATAARLVQQLLVESAVLATAGGVVGLLVAQWVGAAIRSLLLPGDASVNTLTDGRTLGAMAIVTLAVALLTGLAPALQMRRPDLSRTLGAGARGVVSGSSRMRTALLLFQVTLSVVLLVGAGLFVRSLANVRGIRLGYDVTPIVVVTDNSRGVQWTTAERIALEHRLADVARATPGVSSATPAPSIPFWAFEGRYLAVPGVDSVLRLGDFLLEAGNPDYFRTMGTRVLRGRGFTDADRANAPPVTVVSAGMAKALWPGQEAIGKCIRIGADSAPCTTVIGVAEDVHADSFQSEREHLYYVPIAQYADATGMLLVRVAGDAADYAEPLRRTLQRAMPGASYVTTRPLRTLIDPQMRSWRSGATMFAALGGLALVLAGIGLYSVIAYGVAQRRQEIGVRIALGATFGGVVRLIVRGGARLVAVGVILGWLIARIGARWLAPLLFHESATDPLIYVGVGIVLTVVALLATALPAIAAARVDPNVALRVE